MALAIVGGRAGQGGGTDPILDLLQGKTRFGQAWVGFFLPFPLSFPSFLTFSWLHLTSDWHMSSCVSPSLHWQTVLFTNKLETSLSLHSTSVLRPPCTCLSPVLFCSTWSASSSPHKRKSYFSSFYPLPLCLSAKYNALLELKVSLQVKMCARYLHLQIFLPSINLDTLSHWNF